MRVSGDVLFVNRSFVYNSIFLNLFDSRTSNALCAYLFISMLIQHIYGRLYKSTDSDDDDDDTVRHDPLPSSSEPPSATVRSLIFSRFTKCSGTPSRTKRSKPNCGRSGCRAVIAVQQMSLSFGTVTQTRYTWFVRAGTSSVFSMPPKTYMTPLPADAAPWKCSGRGNVAGRSNFQRIVCKFSSHMSS